MLPYSPRNRRTLVFADKIEATMFDTDLWNTVKPYLSECIDKRVYCSLVPDYCAIRKGDT